MTVYNHDQSDFYIDEDAVSAFTGDDTGETVIIADALGSSGEVDEGPFVHFRYRHI